MSVLIMADTGLTGQNQACQEYGTRQAAGTHPETGTRQEAGSLSQGETRQENDRILNGKDCQPQTQPWQAALFLRPNRLYCGAVLVHPQWVLTAAHCQKPAYSVRLGRYHLQGIDPGQRILRGVKSFPHPKYTRPAHSNDLMLIKLNGRVSMTPSIKTIKISTQPPRPGTQCLVSGWGTTSSPQVHYPQVLQCLNITIMSHEACQRAYPGAIDSTMFCAGDEVGKDSCQGDSGGPVVCNGYLQGLVSWGDVPCGQPNKPGVYTNLYVFEKWIEDTIKNNS
ncbi:kallikrein-5 [Monodelphis domestica]|nr:kallikrein-5 [Monodelphis domestica]XP_016277800.2 kallikrein-5 [Monodelphis domestica]XP_016277801.2 kallikrein-5 [Monodelphis domestica]XP_056652920.1 kallikrein-5 [Monodelphis domestica]XP_056652921.1 kallikrein-5 [Monodelphis domestica]